MKLLEVRSVMSRATKYDLFTGELNNLKGKQAIKENTTIFFRDPKTGTFTGPTMNYNNFVELYCKMQFGVIGVIAPVPNVVTNEILFDLVLREASIDDLKYTPRHIKLNRIFYTYDSHILLGPFYTDNSITSLYLENLVAKNQIFVPNERQHFKKRELKKVA
jgi:hypothetical protein